MSDGVIEIIPPRPQGRLVQEGHVWLWESVAGTPPITQEAINRAIEDMREEREREILEGGH